VVSTPPGLPRDWSSLAIQAAKTKLINCADANSLTVNGCPQRLNQGPFAGVEAVHWTLLNDPLAHAVAVPPSQPAGETSTSVVSQVEVSGLFQMDVSYTVSNQGIRPFLAYSGGVARATMDWDGTSFQNVQFGGNILLPFPEVNVPPFTRPSQATDAAVLAAVQTGFQDCDTLHFPPTNPQIPNCPYSPSYNFTYATSAQFVRNSDPMQGALVSFDTQHGNFAVTGTYDENLNQTVQGPPGNDEPTNDGPMTSRFSGQYTATVVWDGTKVQLLTLAR
jgi:hypothetical protein